MNDVLVSAVVDTTAEITIVPQSIHDQMSPCREIIWRKDVSLAGGRETMTVGALGDVLVEIGGTQIRHHVYVAPLQVDMLLGIIFLHENGVQLVTSALEEAWRLCLKQTHPLDCRRTVVRQDHPWDVRGQHDQVPWNPPIAFPGVWTG